MLTRSNARGRPNRLSRLLHTGWPEAFPVVQVPNVPLTVALVATLVARLTDADVHAYAYAIASVGFGVWAYLELTAGINWFRRLLGVAGLVLVVMRLA